MAGTIPVIQRYTDNILTGATWTATVAALASYTVTDLQYLLPAKRILWGVKTVTITATLGVAAQGDVFALPFSNLDAGAAVLAITNNGGGGGVNQAITVNGASPGGWPLTTWFDLTAGWTGSQRTATVWNFVVTANTNNLLLGAALWLSGPKRTLARNLEQGKGRRPSSYARSLTTNEYEVDLVYDYGTKKGGFDGSYTALSTSERDTFQDWIDGCRGGGLPGLFVRDASVNDALLGYMNAQIVAESITYPQVTRFGLSVNELSKGKHL